MKFEVLVMYIIFLYAITFPIFHNKLGNSGAILVNGGLIILTFGYLLIFGNFHLKLNSKSESKIIKIILFLFVFYLFTILLSTTFSPVVIFRDLYELHRPILYTLVLVSACFFFRIKERLKELEKLLIISFIIVFFLGINHYFHIEDSVSALYTKERNILTGRVATPFPNPYDYSFYMLLVFCYFSIKALKTKLIQKRTILSLLCLLTIVGIFSTQSRTGLILLALEIFLIIPSVLFIDGGLSLKRMRFAKKFFRYFILIIIIFTIVFYLYITYGQYFMYLIGGIEKLLLEQELVNAGQVRVDLMQMALDRAYSSFFIFLFGNGPSKAVVESPEAGYAYFIFRYGFSTLILFFFAPLILSCFYLIKIIRQKKVNTEIYMTILAWYLSLPVAYIATNFTEQIRLSFLYYFFMGFSIKSYFILESKKTKVRVNSELSMTSK